MTTLLARGRSVPDDVSLVAICPRDVAVGQPLALTSVDLPAEAIGRIAVEMAMAGIRGEKLAETRLLAPVLTQRLSTSARH